MSDRRISPHYGYEKYASGSLEDLIDVFEDRLGGWLFEPAKALLDLPFGDIVALHLLLGYFEAHSIYRKGQGSNHQSKAFFCDGFAEVFRKPGFPEPRIRRLAEVLYEDARCGLFHEAMFRDRIFVARPVSSKGPFLITLPRVDGKVDKDGEIQSIVIDVREFCHEVERHAAECVKALRDTSNNVLRENFKKAVDLRWGVNEAGRAIGLSEEEWDRMFR